LSFRVAAFSVQWSRSNMLAAGAHLRQHDVDALLVDRAQGVVGEAQRFSLSTQNLRRCRFGMNRRRVLLWACETLLPIMGIFPVT